MPRRLRRDGGSHSTMTSPPPQGYGVSRDREERGQKSSGRHAPDCSPVPFLRRPSLERASRQQDDGEAPQVAKETLRHDRNQGEREEAVGQPAGIQMDEEGEGGEQQQEALGLVALPPREHAAEREGERRETHGTLDQPVQRCGPRFAAALRSSEGAGNPEVEEASQGAALSGYGFLQIAACPFAVELLRAEHRLRD